MQSLLIYIKKHIEIFDSKIKIVVHNLHLSLTIAYKERKFQRIKVYLLPQIINLMLKNINDLYHMH